MTPPTNIDGTEITGATIDGQGVEEITVDGQAVFSAIPDSGDHQWFIDEGSGTTLNDSVGSVNATINGATWESESGTVGGQYLEYDGVDDHFATDSTLGIDKGTVCGWVRPKEFTNFSNMFFIWGEDVNNGDNGIYVATESTEGEILTVGSDPNAGSVLRNVPFVSTNSWGFFGFTWDGTDHRLITFDNSSELADQTASAGKNTSGSETLYVGGNPADGAFLEGDTDFFVATQDRTLTKAEITDLWEATQR